MDRSDHVGADGLKLLEQPPTRSEHIGLAGEQARTRHVASKVSTHVAVAVYTCITPAKGAGAFALASFT